MADPVTANKALAQPVAGTDVGTWATPVNGNMDIVDASFGGVATVALLNTPVVLSSAQYRCAFIRFTGTITANVAITLPNIGSFYTVINDTLNSSAFYVTMATTVAGSQLIGVPPATVTGIMTDGSNVRFRNLPHVGTYWDYSGSSVPAWNDACTVPPWLNCNAGAFSSATYPHLSVILGGTTLPDARGRFRLTLDSGVGRVSSGVSGVPGNTLLGSGGDQNAQQHSHNMTATVTDPGHTHGGIGTPQAAQGGAGTTPQQGSAGVTSSAVTNISVSVVSSAAFTGASQNMPPTYVGGITMIRAG